MMTEGQEEDVEAEIVVVKVEEEDEEIEVELMKKRSRKICRINERIALQWQQGGDGKIVVVESCTNEWSMYHCEGWDLGSGLKGEEEERHEYEEIVVEWTKNRMKELNWMEDFALSVC